MDTLAGYPVKSSVFDCEVGDCVLKLDAGTLLERLDGSFCTWVEAPGDIHMMFDDIRESGGEEHRGWVRTDRQLFEDGDLEPEI